MKIAIISDTHDNWANFKKALDWISNSPAGEEKIKLILHCGDISSQDTVDTAVKYFAAPQDEPRQGRDGQIKFVKGNADHNIDVPSEIEIEAEGKKIAMVHFPDKAKKMAQSGKYDVVFYGHTHRPWDEKIGECHMINPGELAGHFFKATFAVYDTITGKLELKILETL